MRPHTSNSQWLVCCRGSVAIGDPWVEWRVMWCEILHNFAHTSQFNYVSNKVLEINTAFVREVHEHSRIGAPLSLLCEFRYLGKTLHSWSSLDKMYICLRSVYSLDSWLDYISGDHSEFGFMTLALDLLAAALDSSEFISAELLLLGLLEVWTVYWQLFSYAVVEVYKMTWSSMPLFNDSFH